MKKAKLSGLWLLPFFYFSFCLNESVLRAATARSFWQSGLPLACLFALVPAFGMFFLCRLFSPKVNRALELILSWFFFLFYASQLVYFRIFGCFYSAYSMGNGGQVLEFWNVALRAMAESWLPLLILRSPGSIYLDTTVQILQYQGYQPIQASSPVLLTFVYGFLMTLGQRLGGNNLGLFFCVLFQVILGLYALSFGCEEAASRSGKKYIGFLLSLFFGLAMMYVSMAQGALKDSVYSPLFLLLIIFYCRTLEDGSKKSMVPLLILALLCGAARKGGVYLSALILLCLVGKKELRRFAVAACLALVALHCLVNWALYPAVGIESPEEKENYSFFYQLTGYYCSIHPDWVTDEEKEIISQVLDYDTVVTQYDPKIVDAIKATYHADTPMQVQRYLLLHGKLALKHPLTMLEAVVYSRNWYFCPFAWDVEKTIGEVLIGFDYVEPQLSGFSRWLESDARRAAESKLWDFEHSYPVRIFVVSGIYNWLGLLLGLAAWYAGSREKKQMALPVLLAIAGLLLTHINGAVRYAGPVVYSVPVLLVLMKAKKIKPAQIS